MDENDEDVVHFGIVAKSQKAPEFRADLYLATDTPPCLVAAVKADSLNFGPNAVLMCLECGACTDWTR